MRTITTRIQRARLTRLHARLHHELTQEAGLVVSGSPQPPAYWEQQVRALLDRVAERPATDQGRP